jgi:MFS family permease
VSPGTGAGEDILGSLRSPSFRWLWASGLLSGFAMYASILVLSWLALGTDGSSLAVGIVLAARVLPQMLFGIPAGALADRFSRSRLVLVANAGSGVVVGSLCVAWLAGAVGLPVLLVGTFLIGTCDAVRVTAATAMAFDLVERRSAANAIALTNLAAQVSGIFAGIVAGYGLSTWGPTATLLVTGLAYLASAWLVSRVPQDRPSAGHVSGGRVTLRRAATLITRNRQVALIAIVVVGTEMFAFSNMTLMPSFARDVFGIGAAGLGWMLSARAIGGTLGLLAVATTTARWRTVGAFAVLAAAFGVALIAFAVTPILSVALILAGVIGAAGAAVDAVGQSQLQHAVPEAERGSAMGVWMFCVGLGLVGHIETGTLGRLMGAQFAQGLNGAVLVVLATIVGAALPAIRARQPRTADHPAD